MTRALADSLVALWIMCGLWLAMLSVAALTIYATTVAFDWSMAMAARECKKELDGEDEDA